MRALGWDRQIRLTASCKPFIEQMNILHPYISNVDWCKQSWSPLFTPIVINAMSALTATEASRDHVKIPVDVSAAWWMDSLPSQEYGIFRPSVQILELPLPDLRPYVW